MPGQTVNYQLPLPLEDEYYSVAVVNEVTERVDALIREREEEAEALSSSLTALRADTEAALDQLGAELSDELEEVRAELAATQEELGETIATSLTPLAGRMTEAESKIATLWDAVFTNITGNPFTVVLSSLDGITVTAGVWNAAKSRLEC